MKTFLTPSTGKIEDYPDHFAELKPYLIEVTEEGPCVDCVVKQPEEDVVVSTKKTRVSKVAE